MSEEIIGGKTEVSQGGLRMLGSELLYLILYSIKLYKNQDCAIHPDSLGYIIDRVEEASESEIAEFQSEIQYELTEGDYIRPNFLTNLEEYFFEAGDEEGSILFTTIRNAYLQVLESQS